jgi:hypothetical protein
MANCGDYWGLLEEWALLKVTLIENTNIAELT